VSGFFSVEGMQMFFSKNKRTLERQLRLQRPAAINRTDKVESHARITIGWILLFLFFCFLFFFFLVFFSCWENTVDLNLVVIKD